MSVLIRNGEFVNMRFPGGEMHVRVTKLPGGMVNVYPVDVDTYIESSDDIMTLLLLNDALRVMGSSINKLFINYFPYARQDRVCNQGEAFSARVMAKLINSIGAARVYVVDPHSEVTPALLNNCEVIGVDQLLAPEAILEGKLVICPDAGAEKRIQKLNREYVLATKIRNPSNGDIIRTELHDRHGMVEGEKCIIIDDICDGGRTFIELAKVLRLAGAASVELYVTHGIFSQGKEVFRGIIDQIYYFDQGKLTCLL